MKKKLIEVALPLPEINDASSYDKMPGIGPHPKGIHHWWARLPLPTARAVLFASVVTDPSEDPAWKGKTDAEQDAERERLFDIIRRLMGKKLHEHPEVYTEAQAEMLKHCDGKLPPVLDPFAGGGSIPLEANRLGFEAHARDLNPVAVLLNKCNLEITPRWLDHAPVNPEDRGAIGGAVGWRGTHGLAADIRYYGKLIRQRAQELIGHLYPKAQLPHELGGGEADVVAWIWARTVASPDPAARSAHVPLVSSFWLCSKGDNKAWLYPVVDRTANSYRFEIRTGEPAEPSQVKSGTKQGRTGFRCLLTGVPIAFEDVRREGLHGRLGRRLLAIVAESPGGRVYLPANPEHEKCASVAPPMGVLDTELPEQALGFRVQNYGVRQHRQLFTPRQLTSLVRFSDLVRDNYRVVHADVLRAGLPEADATAYASAVTTFLALAVDRCADFNNAQCRWKPSGQ
jgi:putative DNA methylase